MSIQYSTDLEEIAYSKDADVLLAAANMVIHSSVTSDPIAVREQMFVAGQSLSGDIVYFTWHRDDETLLLFKAESAEKLIRSLKDRSEEDTVEP